MSARRQSSTSQVEPTSSVRSSSSMRVDDERATVDDANDSPEHDIACGDRLRDLHVSAWIPALRGSVVCSRELDESL